MPGSFFCKLPRTDVVATQRQLASLMMAAAALANQ